MITAALIGLAWLTLGVTTMVVLWMKYKRMPNMYQIGQSIFWILIWPMMIYYEILDYRDKQKDYGN